MIKEVKNILFKNSNKIIKFELCFKIFTLLIAIPLFLNIFKFIMRLTGYNYLTFENILTFIFNPKSLIMILVFLLVIGFYSIFDIGTIIILLDASKQNKEIKLKDAISISFKKSIKIFKFQNFGLLVFILFLSPFLNLGIGSSVISTIKIPEFIMDFITSNPIFNFLYFILIIFLMILSLKWLYSVHYYFLEDKSFKEARKKSKVLSKKRHIKDLLYISLMQGLIAIGYLIFIIIGIFLIFLFDNIFSDIVILESVFISIIVGFILISLIISAIIDKSITYACISVLFYRHKVKANEQVKHIDVKQVDKKFTKKKWIIVKYSFIFLGLVGTYNICPWSNKGRL